MAVVRVEVRGRVQGVGFRWFAREAARRLGLSGWVRNRDDGCVEIAAQGPDERLRSFLGEIERGPSGARVDAVVPLPAGDTGDLNRPFDVLR
jgi:acylphosphatase